MLKGKGLLFCLVAAALIAAACSSPSVATKEEMKPVSHFHTNAQYIVGNGEAANIETAEKKAIADVMRQIESTIIADTEIEEKIIKILDGETSSLKYIEKIRVLSEFKHGELIRIDKKRSACGKHGCAVVAYMNRSEALDAFQPELKKAMQQFNDGVVFAKASAQAGRLEEFAVHYSGAKENSIVVFGIARQIRALTQRSVLEIDTVLSGLATIEKAAAEMRENVSFTMSVSGAAAGAEGKIAADWFAQAMMKLGLRTQFGSECGAKSGWVYFLEAEVIELFDKAPLGEVVQLSVSYSVKRCSDGVEVVNGSYSGEGLKGFHPKDSQLAWKRAYSGLKEDKEIVSALGKSLSKIVPVRL